MGKKYVSIAKITPPNAAGIAPRKRLFKLVDKARLSPVVFIVSPAGSGKTALLSSYISEKKLHCLWYSVDEGDADVATFFQYMRGAAKKIAPGLRKPLPLFSSDYAHGISVFSRRYFEDLYSRVKPPFLFVFDNFQAVPLHSKFYTMISYGLAEIPDGVNVVILSRKEPPSQFSRLEASSRMQLVGWKEVRFTRRETRDLVRTKSLSYVTKESIDWVYKKADGWAAGLILMFESLNKSDIDLRSLEKISAKRIFGYFAQEIFQKVERNLQKFLVKTAFLQAFTAPMADKITGLHNSEKILDDFIKGYGFTEVYFQEKAVYHYHPLFREFLISRAEDLFEGGELAGIKQDASSIMEESGRIEEAFQLLRESGNVRRLAEIIRNHAEIFIKQGRNQTVLNWIQSLPKKTLSSDPWLQYWIGVCRLPFDSAESLVHFEEAFHKFRERKDVPGIFLSWSGIMESIMYGRESLKELDAWFSIIEDMMTEFKEFPFEYIEVKVLCSMVRSLALRRPSHVKMDKWIYRVRDVIKKSKDVQSKINCLVSLACYLYSGGNFRELAIVLESLQALLKQREIDPLTMLTFDWVNAAYYNVMSMYEDGVKVVSEGRKLARSLGFNVMEFVLLGHAVLISLKTGDFVSSEKYLNIMQSCLPSVRPWETEFYHYCSAWEALYRDDPVTARTHSEQCLRMCEHTGNPWTTSTAHVLHAVISFIYGKQKEAFKLLLKARSIGSQCKNEFIRYICLFTEAYFYLQQGKESPGLDAIRKGMRMGREKGFVNIFMWKRGVMERVVTKAIEHGIEVTYLKDLIRKNALLPEASHLEIDLWPWPLKIFTLGRFTILKGGVPLNFSGKAQHKPLLILKTLIALGGREVAEERIADMIWPEAYGDAAHSAFTTTLSRLRQLVGMEEAVKVYQGKVFLDNRYCCTDIWEFERILGRLDSMWEKGFLGNDMRKAVQLAEKALKLYKGPFLSGDNEPWLLSTRERLRNKFLRNVKRLGNYWEYAGKSNKALECYEKGLEVDDLAEEFYRQIMKCYRQMGKPSEAIIVYKRCHQILSSILGIEPSSETKAIYEILKS
jgi:LuxR family maltose regulon positive regulatory protein